jgi:glutamate/tyrosine decarboxylase-like PLP-dependent enzyme
LLAAHGRRVWEKQVDDNAESLEAALRDAAERGIAYRRSAAERPQPPQIGYREALAAFEGPTPEEGSAAPDVIAALAETAEPGLHTMVGPRFFGWVVGASHPLGVAADWLTSAWGQNAGNHHAAPAAAAAEETAAGWLLDLLGLPRESSLGFVTGATVANTVCLAAARGAVLRRVGWDPDADGLFGAPPIRVVIGDDAHTTVFSALQFLGLGHDRVVRVPTDAAGRIIVDGFGTGAFDPFTPLAEIAHAHDAWLHVDGAFGLWARACPERASLAVGVELADSWAVDGHKWLQTPYECGYAIVREAEAHRRAMTIAASYLPERAADERDPSHYGPELSRRARGFATWVMIKHLGRRGIADMIERHCSIARAMAARLNEAPGVGVLNEVELNQVSVRFGIDEPVARGDELTRAVIDRTQTEGILYAGGGRWRGQWMMRLSVIAWPTTMEQADRAVDAILDAWRAVRDE